VAAFAKKLAYYTNNKSGMSRTAPNARNMAQDAVSAALRAKVPFPSDLSSRDDGYVTALFIIHAGRGAEIAGSSGDVWSHKWTLPTVVNVGDDLQVAVYLTVPEDCSLGVSAHELGHLAFEWDDFYDANYNEDHHLWAGSGNWDLMASGSYNGNSKSPAHPVGLHKMQHNWVKTQSFTSPGQYQVTLPARTEVVKIVSPVFGRSQCLVLEGAPKNRI
jgi:immune inhibitor A